jgi:hypothetical protein
MPIGLPQRLNPALTSTANLVQWLNPPCCRLCEQIHNLRQAICFHCQQALPRNGLACGQCGLPLGVETRLPLRHTPLSERCINCLRSPPHFQQTLAPFLMQGQMQKLIHLWKFQGQSQLTPQLGALFASAASHERFQSIPESAVLVPVPTQWYRQVRRGFDHTWLLAMTHPFDVLTPDRVVSCVEAIGLRSDLRLLALNSYENRVYQVGLEDADPVIVKFYRPGRWTRAQILEEHTSPRSLVDNGLLRGCADGNRRAKHCRRPRVF